MALGASQLARIAEQTCQPADSPEEQLCTRAGRCPVDHGNASPLPPQGMITLAGETQPHLSTASLAKLHVPAHTAPKLRTAGTGGQEQLPHTSMALRLWKEGC